METNQLNWHKEWQSHFPTTEHNFIKNDNNMRNRRADIFIKEHNMIIEIQHSEFESEKEVIERMNDYESHGLNIIWIIDGNDCEIIKTQERCILHISKTWEFEFFYTCDYIFINKNELVYKIYPEFVEHNEIDVDILQIFDECQFIEMLETNNPMIYEFNEIDIPEQSYLYITQMGAGNGKTYSIVQNLQNEMFECYEYFIYVTEQHSAKEIIAEEIQQQIENSDLKIHVTEEFDEQQEYYSMEYELNDRDEILTISTIDSLMFRIGDKTSKSVDFFAEIVNSVINGYQFEKEHNKLLYKNALNINNIYIEERLCVIVDETQDLHENYGKALLRLIDDNHIDVHIMGDKLQSILCDKNAFQYLINVSTEQHIKEKFIPEIPTNICRRFINRELVEKVNEIIKFNEYLLPQITPYKECHNTEQNFIPVLLEHNKNDDKNNDENNEHDINLIMEEYEYEIEENECKINDFLIVTPFVKTNNFVDLIEMAINEYWTEENNDSYYERYALFHESEEGTSINTELSEDCTRIVSIHSSKGDGREIVFVIGCNESALELFSNGDENNLVYESLLHVAITRMKEKIYYCYNNNNDDIHCRLNIAFEDTNEIKPIIQPIFTIEFDDIIKFHTNDEIHLQLKEMVIDKSEYDPPVDNEEKEIIDIQHHSTRYFCMHMSFILQSIEYDNAKFQLTILLKQLHELQITNCETWQEYNECLFDNENIAYDINNKTTKNMTIPIILYEEKHNKIYHECTQYILTQIDELKTIVEEIVQKKNNDCILQPYQLIVLHYIAIVTYIINPSIELTYIELINITNNYINKNKFIEQSHYDLLENCKENYCEFFDDCNGQMNILINQHVKYRHSYIGDKEQGYNIWENLSVVYNDEEAYIIHIHPQYNNLNYCEIIMESIFDTFLLEHEYYCKNTLDDISTQKIFSIVFTSETQYYKFDWNPHIDDNVEWFKQNIINYVQEEEEELIEPYQEFAEFIYYNENNDLSIEEKIAKIEDDSQCPAFLKDLCNIIIGNLDEKTFEQQKTIIEEELFNFEYFESFMQSKIKKEINDVINSKI